MKRIVQKSGFDCAICSIAMVTGVPYATVKRAAKKRANYSSQKKNGTKSNRIKNVVEETGEKTYSVPVGEYFNMASALKGRRGVLLWRNKDPLKCGHAVAWDGFKVVCPGSDSPDKVSIEYYNNYLQKTEKNWCGVIGVETPMYMRVASLVYCFFPTAALTIKTEIKDDYKRASDLLRKARVNTSKYIRIFARSMVCCFRLNKSTTRP